MIGNQILEEKTIQNSPSEINTTTLVAGVYFVRIKTEKQEIIERIIIQ